DKGGGGEGGSSKRAVCYMGAHRTLHLPLAVPPSEEDKGGRGEGGSSKRMVWYMGAYIALSAPVADPPAPALWGRLGG
ncbi:MAG: hypothetical protein D6816_03520, partial [Bacteroidetes bacterium]